MKRLTTAIAFLPATAFAHVGDHPTSFSANFVHLLTEPNHLIMLGCAAALAVVMLYLRKAGKL